MGQTAAILIFLAIGVMLRLSGRLPDTTPKVLSGWVINVALPAAAINDVHNVTVRPDWWLAAATPWMGVVLAIVVLVPLCRVLGWTRQRTGALLLLAGWGNTAFVGLPMIAAYAGSQWLGLGIVIDQFGSYLSLTTVGIAIATIASTGRLQWGAVGKRIVTFPPAVAIAVALATNTLPRPEWLTGILDSLAHTLTPIALAAVGYALRLDQLAGRFAPLGVGLVFRLVFAPLVFVLMYVALGSASDPVAKVAMLEMAMPAMMGASIIALDHDLEPELVALLIGIGIPLSMLTSALWWPVIQRL